jgi:hypothetical protein
MLEGGLRLWLCHARRRSVEVDGRSDVGLARLPLALAIGLLSILVAASIGVASAAAEDTDGTVTCANYRATFESGTVEARHMDAHCRALFAAGPPTLPAGAAAPELAEPGPALAALEREIAERVEAYHLDGNYAVAVTDLQTGETIEVGGHRRQLAGCSINFFVMLQASIDEMRGQLTSSQIDSLLHTTVHYSDPVSARKLYELAGDGELLSGIRETRSLIWSLGLRDTRLDHAPLFISAASIARTDNHFSAADANRALAMLWWGQILPVAERDKLLDTMADVKPGLNYLTAYGTGGTVSHKNGFFPVPSGGWWVDNDIGIVRFEQDGETYAYAISFLSERVHEKYGSLSLFRPISELVWEYFDRTYS